MRRSRPGSCEAHVGEELGAFGGIELGDLGLHGAADGDHLSAFLVGALLDGGRVGVAGAEGGLVDVGDVELGLGW